jgi:hypothetical protein
MTPWGRAERRLGVLVAVVEFRATQRVTSACGYASAARARVGSDAASVSVIQLRLASVMIATLLSAKAGLDEPPAYHYTDTFAGHRFARPVVAKITSCG